MTVEILCDDWSCSAWVSCAHSFGRSAVYAGARRKNYETRKLFSPNAKGACINYETDKPKAWLLPAALQGKKLQQRYVAVEVVR